MDAARPTPGEPAASWRSLLPSPPAEPVESLALGVELRQRETSAEAHWAPRRIQAVTPRRFARDPHDLLVGLRPLMRGAGGWIKGDVTWESLRRSGRGRRWGAAQVRWFTELHALARDDRILGGFTDTSEWLTLDTIEASLLWVHLGAAAALGIPVVPTRKDLDVALARGADVDVVLTREDEGLRLAPRVEIDGAPADAPTVRPVARSGLYAVAPDGARLRVTLAPVPLSETARAVLLSPGPIIVPAQEVDDFVRDAYPALSRHLTPAPELDLPAPPHTTLVAAVAFRPGDTIEYTFRWERAGAGSGAYDPPADDTESAAADALERAWADSVPLPFAPAATLRGIDAAEFGARALPLLESLEGVRVVVTGTRRSYRELTDDPRITVSTVESTDPDWFDLGIIVEIGGRRVPFTPLFTALALRRKKILLSDGRYFSLAHPALDRLRELIDEAAGFDEWEAGPRISRYQTALWSDFEDLADISAPAVSWREAASALRNVDRVEQAPLPTGLRAELRPYQRDGFDRLAFLWQHRLGGILADDMGLGKTLQVLALLAHARETGERRPFLVVAPTSVLSVWREEAARFTPGLRVRVVDSTSATRGTPLAVATAGADIIVTSYTLLRLDEAEFTAPEWALVILDEAQFVKNPRTRAYRAAAGLHADVTLAVTGTPLENSLAELWTLLSLTSPGLFASARRFREEYVKPIEQGKVPENVEGGPYRARRIERLRHRIRPFVLRRTKELVASELPPRQEQELRIELSSAHRAVYDTVLQRERQKVLGLLEDLDRNRFIVFRSLTLLRMLALAPSLVDAGNIRSSKLDALLERLDEVVAEGHRALVFSQFTSYLSLVSAALDAHGIRHVSLDGSTRDRAGTVEEFRAGDAPVFLISLKAGGFGLTLTEADYVFLLDPWWNPAAEAQAIDRTHRIGQHRPVNVYRLIADGTIEEKVLALQERKSRLFHAVLDDDEMLSRALTAEDIRDLFED
ncbi:DEAD/DEAH box helicase [uncultured Microbacterium sp.]|uniref:Superfamily II DNA/RNA helicase, SNF2 family n=1 Tax=uncultured Microbacterium sp. TaxID=191216 RepID=A0A1Y5PC93_9MICO|nr:DEAD/DEAH box helicase [uncultured Microbacterium sp.]SBS75090.1 Superfamily II DNA/RNA helicase, SNF2 family [uncultured Microbacterium sp.]